MLGNIAKVWHEELFVIDKANKKEVVSDVDIYYEPITLENIKWVENLRGKEYICEFEKQLSYGDFGYYAMVNGNPVAYGWVKHEKSKDYFFRIESRCCYLCRFFTHESSRGHNIYPCLISSLIEHEKECNRFYIDIEKGNIASEKGLSKVGFKKIRNIKFFRAFRITFNKFLLKSN